LIVKVRNLRCYT